MWPTLFGSGWVWNALVAGSLVCFMIGVLGFLFLVTAKPARQPSDEFDEAWRRFKEVDFTHSGIERAVYAGHRGAAVQ